MERSRPKGMAHMVVCVDCLCGALLGTWLVVCCCKHGAPVNGGPADAGPGRRHQRWACGLDCCLSLSLAMAMPWATRLARSGAGKKGAVATAVKQPIAWPHA
eukprot:365632-Chlamydomonas_euryale.AAC.11